MPGRSLEVGAPDPLDPLREEHILHRPLYATEEGDDPDESGEEQATAPNAKNSSPNWPPPFRRRTPVRPDPRQRAQVGADAARRLAGECPPAAGEVVVLGGREPDDRPRIARELVPQARTTCVGRVALSPLLSALQPSEDPPEEDRQLTHPNTGRIGHSGSNHGSRLRRARRRSTRRSCPEGRSCRLHRSLPQTLHSTSSKIRCGHRRQLPSKRIRYANSGVQQANCVPGVRRDVTCTSIRSAPRALTPRKPKRCRHPSGRATRSVDCVVNSPRISSPSSSSSTRRSAAHTSHHRLDERTNRRSTHQIDMMRTCLTGP